MSNFVTLLGAKEVGSAANRMRGAADEMRHAASTIDSALRSHEQFLTDWLNRLEQVLTEKESKS